MQQVSYDLQLRRGIAVHASFTYIHIPYGLNGKAKIMQYSCDELLALENDTIFSFKGRQSEILLSDGETISGIVTGFELAANHPYLVCTIIINGIQKISLQRIKKLNVI